MRLVLLTLAGAALSISQPQPQLIWQGEVDGKSILHFRGNRVDVEDMEGQPVQGDKYRYFERLPNRNLTVRLVVAEGRGSVRIVQQPRPDNNYTLSVQIEDRNTGRGFYSLAFYWEPAGGNMPLPYDRPGVILNRPRNPDEERLTWSGRVDDEVIVECRANDCRSQVVRGNIVVRERVETSGPLPDRDVRVRLENADGRGEVQVVEQPGPYNNYTTRVRIRDTQGGSGDYAFSLVWPKPSRNEPDRLFARTGVVWYGRVDGRVRVAIQENSALSELLNGAPVQGERAVFSRPLSRRTATPNAQVKKIRGRGKVEIVEFPSDRNGYRLVFEVNDSSGGADDYEVEIGW